MESILESLGAEVYSAPGGAEGLGILKRCSMDVLFVDLRLQESDGISVAKEASLIQPRIPTVIMTGYPSVQSSVTALHNGFCDYVTKPVTRERFQAALVRASAYTALFKDIEAGRRGNGRTGAKGNGGTDGPVSSCEIVAASRAMSKVLTLAKEVARTDAPVLIQGEKGVGKALLARAIHKSSNRAAGPFAHLLCKGVREDQLEAVLSSAQEASERSRAGGADDGVWAQAHQGSLFLDDVSELPFWAQVKLLDVLEGKDGVLSPDARAIASASCDLDAAVDEGRFSRELYFHLDVASIHVPPLRRRREDIRLLAEHLLDRFKRQLGPSVEQAAFQFSGEAWDVLTRHDWPGNADELANVLRRAVLLTKTSQVEAAVVQKLLRSDRFAAAGGETVTVPLEGDLKKIQRQIVREVIDRCSGNKAAAARSLGLHRKTIYRLLQEDNPLPETTAAWRADATGVPSAPP